MAWNDLPLSDKARMMKLAVSSGITDLRTIQEVYNKFAEGGEKSDDDLTQAQKDSLIARVNASNADFVKRLQDKNRKYIDYGDSIATHRMAYATDENGNAIVYPEVQSVGDTLQWFRGWDAYDRAVNRGDTLQMSIPEAEWFTTNYKKYYPKGKTFADGGGIHIKPSHRGKFTALKKRTGHSASWFKAHGTPAQKKMATFALNAKKWHHAYGGPLIYPFSNREIPDVRYDNGGLINNLYDYVSMPYQSVPTVPYAPNDFSGIKTTGNRKYDESYVSYINDRLANKGVNKTKREALIANIIEESGGDPYADSKTGFKGLLQWSKNRYWPEENLLPQEYNKPYTELDKQINYIYNTTNTPDTRNSWNKGYQTDINKVGRAIDQYNNYHDATSLEDTMKAITYGYVRPAGKDNSYKNRSRVAKQLKNKINH